MNTAGPGTFTSVFRYWVNPTWRPWQLAPVVGKPNKKRWVRFTTDVRHITVEGGVQAVPLSTRLGPVVPA